MAPTLAGTRFPPSHCASFRAASRSHDTDDALSAVVHLGILLLSPLIRHWHYVTLCVGVVVFIPEDQLTRWTNQGGTANFIAK